MSEKNSPSTLEYFDYSTLESETRIAVQQRTSEIKSLMRRSAQNIVDIGQKLIEVKEQLGHGHFCKWLQAEFEWSERTAVNFMQVSEKFKSANFADLNLAASALYKLAAPSTPEEARQEALERAAAGETITFSKAQAIKESYQPNKRERRCSHIIDLPAEAVESEDIQQPPSFSTHSHSTQVEFTSSPLTSESQTIDVSASTVEKKESLLNLGLEPGSRYEQLLVPDSFRITHLERKSQSPQEVETLKITSGSFFCEIECTPEPLIALLEQMRDNPGSATNALQQLQRLAITTK